MLSATGSGFCFTGRAFTNGGGGCFGCEGSMTCFCMFSATGLDELDVDDEDPTCECKASTMVSRRTDFEAGDCFKESVLMTGLGSELSLDDCGEGTCLRRTHGTGRTRY
jgi:hypothetical protein